MKYSKEIIEKMAKENFGAQLFNVYAIFDSSEFICLRRDDLVDELALRKKKEERLGKISQIPIVGKTIYRVIPKNNVATSFGCEFMLSIMDKLGVDYLDANIINYIRENPNGFYEKYYREDFECMLNDGIEKSEEDCVEK